jgi:hypothetical protein
MSLCRSRGAGACSSSFDVKQDSGDDGLALRSRLGQGQKLVQSVKLPTLPMVELGHGNEPPSRVFRTTDRGI